jgi:hypothetical protein
VNGAGAQKTNSIGFLGPDPSTVFDGPARPSRHGASSAPSRRADCRKRVLPGRFRPARPGPSQWFTVECQSRPRPSHPASCDRRGVLLGPTSEKGELGWPCRRGRTDPVDRLVRPCRRSPGSSSWPAGLQILRCRATCVGCHHTHRSAPARRASSSAAARTDSADTVSNTPRGSLARSFAAWLPLC